MSYFAPLAMRRPSPLSCPFASRPTSPHALPHISLHRTVVSKQYLGDMHRAKVIVTANPSGWEGGLCVQSVCTHKMLTSRRLFFLMFCYVLFC